MAVSALIFDLDGTIIDTEQADFDAWLKVYERHGIELTADMWALRVGWVNLAMFDPAKHLEAVIGKPLSDDELKHLHEEYMHNCERQPILPGVMDMIEQATKHNLKLGMASNSDRTWVEYWLKFHHLDHYFQCVYTRDDVTNPKPAPDMYTCAANCLNIPVEQCVAFEDSPVGMQAAISAGIRTVAIPNWITSKLERPAGLTRTLNSLADLSFETLLREF
ncbi:MAG: HAD family phosphatase [Anaerolineae bacterium]|nr:HAD family phosphatase [Anaerolineae bacterium]